MGNAIDKKLYLFGGTDGSKTLYDLWSYDTTITDGSNWKPIVYEDRATVKVPVYIFEEEQEGQGEGAEQQSESKKLVKVEFKKAVVGVDIPGGLMGMSTVYVELTPSQVNLDRYPIYSTLGIAVNTNATNATAPEQVESTLFLRHV